MKTSIDTIAAFIAAAIWADGVYDEAEKIAVEEIADALELDADAFNAAIEENIRKVDAMKDDEVNEFLRVASDGVDDMEIGMLYQAAMQIIITDNKLSFSEVDNLLFIAEVLGIEDSMAVLMLADMVKTEPELEIAFDE
ncbi:MAG: hypothetical protein MJZ81_01490 [Bacteroidales bacterium]|nr:hypothetical protein [Bacteroidales bacterium]